MASKESRGSASRAAVASAQLRKEAERSIQKERYKDAVKQAKMAFKEEGTPENHHLLESAFFLRARQLLQQGMRNSAIEVAQHLLDFGVTGADSVEDLVRLLITLGFERPAFAIQERMGSPELKGRLSELAADQAVLHPRAAGGTVASELARDAGLIRQSLERLQARDDAGALAPLRDLARSSPLSEWKFFIRGLAGFYRGDTGEMQANWERLDRQRKAFPIAVRLRHLTESSATAPSDLEVLEKLVFGEPILDRLGEMRSFVASQDWDKVLRLMGPLRQSLQRVDPRLGERLTAVLIGSLIKAAQDMRLAEARRLVNHFSRAAQPLAIDPRWNRLWGILWDGPYGDPEGGIRYWLAYINDLKSVATLNHTERTLAQAIVWNHVAELRREVVDALSEPDDLDIPPFLRLGRREPELEIDPEELADARKEVIDSLEHGLQLAPQYLPTYRMLVAVYDKWNDHANMTAAARRLLEVFPEDFETFQLLAGYYSRRHDLPAALPYVQKARRLKPLDESLREQEWTIRVGLARQYALAQDWDQGRAEFAAAEALKPDCRQQYLYLARKALFELKAGKAEESHESLRRAQARLVEPAPLWLALTIESIRYHMPRETVDLYTQHWNAELKQKGRSETAGELAELMGTYLRAGVEYPGRAEHVQQVTAYLGRGIRLKYRREDLERIVEFLGRLAGSDDGLREKLIKAGVKQHPDSVLLNLHAATLVLGKESFFVGGGATVARRHLETALKLAEASTDPSVTALLPRIRAQLGFLDEVDKRISRFGGFFGGGLPYPPSFLAGEDDDDDLDDEELDNDLDDGEFEPAPRPAPARPKTKKRSSRKRR